MHYDLDLIKMGMIGLVEDDGSFVGKTIHQAQLDLGFPERAARWTHCFISGGEFDEVSATFPLSKRRTLRAYNGRRVLFLYHKDIQFRNRLRYKMAFFAASCSNLPYGVQSLIWFLLPKWLRGGNNWLAVKWMKFCSWLVDYSFKKIKIDLFPGPENVTVPAAFFMHPDFEHFQCLRGAPEFGEAFLGLVREEGLKGREKE